MPWQRTRCARLVVLGILCFLAVSAIMWNIRSKFRGHAAVSDTTVIRRARAAAGASSMDLYRNKSSWSLLFPSRTPGTPTCTKDLTDCQLTASCSNTARSTTNCHCHQGFFLRDSACHACTVCDRTQYVATECSTHRDTICIDVSFPVGILPMNQSHLLDDGTEISTTHSSNVFLERLIKMDALETAMYVTNNQQSLDFAWPRISGLDIAVSVSDVYLVPDYHDVEAVDDTALFHRLSDPSQRSKLYYNHVQSHYCRHPLPDYYSIQMELIANRTSTAQVVRCDSQDESVTRCPDHYKDGDRFLKWNINAPCPSYMTTKLTPLKDGPNSVVCTEETDILRQVFHRSRPTTQEYMFPSRECELYRQKCDQCLKSSTCPANSTNHNDPHQVEGQCCGIHCYWQTYCRKTFGPDCPLPSVECATGRSCDQFVLCLSATESAVKKIEDNNTRVFIVDRLANSDFRGEVNIFSLFPHFDSLDFQFACHLRYVPPQKLYSLSYTINIPSVSFNTTSQHFTVASNSRGDHERRLSHFDFITALHDTRIKVAEELVLIGNHNELKHYHARLMQPYTIRDLKTASDLKKEKASSKGNASRAAYVQFEKPFLFSSRSWYKDGCRKNVSQIYPNQTIYKEDFTPVIARKSLIELEPNKALFSSQEFTYQLYHRDRAPYVKFFIEKGKSVLQHLQGRSARGQLVAGSLHTSATWHQAVSKWKLVFSALQDECPSIISVKIFTQLMSRCVGHFDLLINCPLNFTVTFDLPAGASELPDIFVLQVNDSSASHNIVLTLIYPPSIINENISQHAGELQSKQSSTSNINSVFNIWISIIIIVIITVILLIINCIFLKYIHTNVKKTTFAVSKNSEGMTLKQQESDVPETYSPGLAISQNKSIISLFVLLYTLYSFMFTFSLGFGIIYLTQSSVWSDIAGPKNLSKELLVLVDKSLHEITQFEEEERTRLYASFKERTKSCLQHLKSKNRKHLLNYQRITKQNIDVVFTKNGTLHYLTNEIQKRNFSVYLQHILEFVTECNKTLTSIVDRFQANYYLFIRNTVHNDWLKVPRQIFLYQDGEDTERKYLSSTQVKQFATWLEVDKADELFAVKENVFGRLSSIAAPQVSVLDLDFPSLHPHLEMDLQESHTVNDSYMYSVLDPLIHSTESFPNDTLAVDQLDVTIRSRRDSEMLQLNRGLQPSHDNTLSSHYSEEQGAFEIESEISNQEPEVQNGVSYKTKPHVHNNNDVKKPNDQHEFHGSLADVQTETSNSEMKIYHPSLIEDFTSTSAPHSQATENGKLYILIAVFLTFDFVLLVYRAAWLRRQLHAVCNGFPEKIPLDEACKQLVAIQTNSQYSKTEEPARYFITGSSRYYVTGSAVAYHRENEIDVAFFKDSAAAECNANSFQRIWNEKVKKTENSREKENGKRLFLQRYGYAWRVLRQVFHSHLVWQGSVTFLVIVCVCVLIYCVELCLTPGNFQTLVGGQSAVADVQWHVDTSSQYLKGLAVQLTAQLQQLKHLCDDEVSVLTDVYYTTVNMQTSVFADVLQKLCHQVKGKNCDKLLTSHFTGERIVGCNFLPLHAQTFPDLSLSQMDAIVLGKLTPLKNLSHHLLLVTASVIVFFVCGRLVCQTTAATVKHYLLQTGRLSQVPIYQSEKVYITATGRNSTMMQRSQSWVDSCESGVYLGETEDTNKDDAS